MTDTGGGTQLITAVAPGTGSTSGTVTWWDRKDGRWVAAGSAPARFGAKGLAGGAARRQGADTTPTGLYGMPYAFGIEAAPRGTAMRKILRWADPARRAHIAIGTEGGHTAITRH